MRNCAIIHPLHLELETALHKVKAWTSGACGCNHDNWSLQREAMTLVWYCVFNVWLPY